MQFSLVQNDISGYFTQNIPEAVASEIKDQIYPLEDDLSKLNRWSETIASIGLLSSRSESEDAIAMYSGVRSKVKDFLQFYYTKILQNPLFYRLMNKGQIILDAIKSLDIIINRMRIFGQEKFGEEA